MPNWTDNRITVKNTGNGFLQAKNLFTSINGEEPEPFNELIPKPKDDLKMAWYLDNWGSKWEAHMVDFVYATESEFKVFFRTPWAPPIPIFEALCIQFPELTIAFDVDSMESNFVGSGAYAPDTPFSIGRDVFWEKDSDYICKPRDLSIQLIEFSKQFSKNPFTEWGNK